MVMPGFKPYRRVSKLCTSAGLTRSVLLRTIRSAIAACETASNCESSVAAACAASTTVTTPSIRVFFARKSSTSNVCKIGPGSANPVVSITIRSNATSFCTRRSNKSAMVLERSPRTEQHRHPDRIKIISSLLSSIRS